MSLPPGRRNGTNGGRRPARFKFVVAAIERHLHRNVTTGPKNERHDEVIFIKLRAVFAPRAGSENREYWEEAPYSEVTLGTLNQERAEFFQLGAEYYVTFTRAPPALDAK